MAVVIPDGVKSAVRTYSYTGQPHAFVWDWCLDERYGIAPTSVYVVSGDIVHFACLAILPHKMCVFPRVNIQIDPIRGGGIGYADRRGPRRTR